MTIHELSRLILLVSAKDRQVVVSCSDLPQEQLQRIKKVEYVTEIGAYVIFTEIINDYR